MKTTLLVVILGVVLMTGASQVYAASQTSVSGASSAVQSAFVVVQAAGKDGGNITNLAAQLNSALGLIQKASAENSSNPAQASADLQAALAIAQQAQSSAANVAQQGTSARQLQLELSISSAVVIVAIAVALYVYGDRIYRRLWLRMYRGQVVKKIG